MYLDEIKARLKALNLVHPNELLACTEDEVRSLEQGLGYHLPEAYREFLLWMGHGAGILLRGSDCFYKDLPYLQEWAIELLKENHFPEQPPSDAFVFFMHQGYQFNFFRLSEGADPPVYFYGEWTSQTSFSMLYPKYSDFLMTEIEGHAKAIVDSGN